MRREGATLPKPLFFRVPRFGIHLAFHFRQRVIAIPFAHKGSVAPNWARPFLLKKSAENGSRPVCPRTGPRRSCSARRPLWNSVRNTKVSFAPRSSYLRSIPFSTLRQTSHGFLIARESAGRSLAERRHQRQQNETRQTAMLNGYRKRGGAKRRKETHKDPGRQCGSDSLGNKPDPLV